MTKSIGGVAKVLPVTDLAPLMQNVVGRKIADTIANSWFARRGGRVSGQVVLIVAYRTLLLVWPDLLWQIALVVLHHQE